VKTYFRLLFFLVAAALLIYAVTEMAIAERQEKIEQRALRLEQKDCYSWQDIEIIVHGEIQE